MTYDYDMIVIGAGAAGLTAAVGAAGIGAKVLLIESEKFGGDCTHYGCVPSKALIHAAHIAHADQRRADVGLSAGRSSASAIRDVLTHIDHIVRDVEERFDSIDVLEQSGVEVLQARAYFHDENTVVTTIPGKKRKKKLTAKKFVIATGARPRALPPEICAPSVGVHTNRSVFEPRAMTSLVVIGSGPIGVELAQAYVRLGVAVTIITRDAIVLSREEEAASEIVERALLADGIDLIYSASLQKIQKNGRQKDVIYSVGESGKEKKITASDVLVAIGRTPNVEGLGLEEIGVEFDTRKGVEVNARAQTSMPHIYAVGDVASQWKFTHYAGHMAKVMLAHALFHIPSVRVEERVIPRATFTDPEIASIGITSRECATWKEGSYHILTKDYSHVDRAITDHGEDGMMQIIVDRRGQILGATIVGAHASELINEVALAMKHRITITGLADTIHAYPTYGYGLRHCADQFRARHYTAERRRWVQRLFGLRGR